jgi:hypothetical protein
MSTEDLAVKFIDGLSFAAEGMCLYWIKEIHIDKSHEGKPEAASMIKHEKRHYWFFKKMQKARYGTQYLWTWANNLWDWLDCFRLAVRYPKAFPEILLIDCTILGAILYTLAGVLF